MTVETATDRSPGVLTVPPKGGDPLLRALKFVGLGKRPVVYSLALGAAGALSALGLAALSAWLITRAWQMPPVLYLSVAVTAVRALGISRAVFRYLERLATHSAALTAMASARERVYRALAGGSPGYSVGLRQSELLSRTADDVDEIGNAVIRGLIPMGVSAVTSIAAVVIMAFVSPLAAAILGVALLVSGAVAPWLASHGSMRAIESGSGAREDVAEAASTLLWHGPELAVAGRRGELLAAMGAADRRAEDSADTGMRWQSLAKAATPLSMAVSLLAAALIAVDLASAVPGSLAGVSSTDGVLTPMMLGILVLLPLSSFETTGPLTEAGIAWESGRQSARRVMDLVDGALGATGEVALDADPVIDRRPVELRAEHLQWGWDRPLGTPEGFTASLVPGDRLVVVGPSGAGKSTLLLTLAGLLPARGGEVVVRHADDDSAAALRSSVCYFAEEGHLFSTSVRENLLVARGDATDDEVREALERVGLSEWVAGLPDGLDNDLIGGGSSLSGGQRRRLLLARALLHPAPVVLLDEPAEHLDAVDARRLMAQICAPDGLFGEARIVVAVTHQHADAGGAQVLHVSSR